ncbi:class I SAM-dependent methyltransferase [Asanoa sp. NPDC049573]|uniref:class I SAM-dependent methyltransferase n=1 Tax=Asanoa sp. NPDC049573 TaxID=3155396 RepID=UPI003442656F
MADLFDYDAELRPHNARLRAAAGVGPGDRVLDIGCGTGQTTREAAQAAVGGHALGVDISAPMLERARKLSAGLDNVSFEQADAQTHPFPPGRFDVCLSRFGTMFFADPVAAFGNIGRALRPKGRLVLLVWQPADRNEWTTMFGQAATTNGPNAFALADPAVTERILTAAGFAEVSFTDVHEPAYYGRDTAAACDNVLRLWKPDDERARDRLRDVIAAHDTGDGVYFDSRAWLVTARTAG